MDFVTLNFNYISQTFSEKLEMGIGLSRDMKDTHHDATINYIQLTK